MAPRVESYCEAYCKVQLSKNKEHTGAANVRQGTRRPQSTERRNQFFSITSYNTISQHKKHDPFLASLNKSSAEFEQIRARLSRKGEDLGRGVLSHDHDGGSRVAGNVTGEDGSIDDKQVVGAVDLGVEVDDGGTAAAAIIGAHLAGAYITGQSLHVRIYGF